MFRREQLGKLLIATTNPGKIKEMRSLLAGLPGVDLLTPRDLEMGLDVPETGASYAENAALKAQTYAQASGLPAIADDSGLEVEALDGAPGLYSARYAPQPQASDSDRRAYLLAQLEGRPRPWRAVFRSTVCLALPDGEPFHAEGECRGEIIPEERGQGGFGYDPIFLVEGTGRTMAELSLAEKNQLSHRALAIRAAKEQISHWLNTD